jgi:hypothetical protein
MPDYSRFAAARSTQHAARSGDKGKDSFHPSRRSRTAGCVLRALRCVRAEGAGLIAAIVLSAVAVGWSHTGRGAPRGLRAPELRAERWINSSPLTLSQLRGKVVAVEFWTFG